MSSNNFTGKWKRSDFGSETIIHKYLCPLHKFDHGAIHGKLFVVEMGGLDSHQPDN